MTMLHLDKDFDPRDRWSTPGSVRTINRQLEHALMNSNTPDESAMLAENLADYLYFWIDLRVEAGMVNFGTAALDDHEALKAYFNRSSHYFVPLASAVNVEMSKARNQNLRERVSRSGQRWYWTDLAKEVFGLEPVQPQDSLVDMTENTAHITLSILPAHPS